MRTIEVNIFTFDELSEKAKQKAINDHRSSGTCGEFVWSDTKEEAKRIGLKIQSLNDYRFAGFIESAQATAKLILTEHGEMCDTYKTAQNFISECAELREKAEREGKDGDEDYWFAEETEELETEFLKSLLQDYQTIYNKDIEYQESDEAIIETINANNYEFTEDGELI